MADRRRKTQQTSHAYHATSQAKHYRVRDKQSVAKFYLKGPESQEGNLSDASSARTTKPLMTDIVRILSKMHNARGMSAKEIQGLLVQQHCIGANIPTDEVRKVIRQGIRERRIKKVNARRPKTTGHVGGGTQENLSANANDSSRDTHRHEDRKKKVHSDQRKGGSWFGSWFSADYTDDDDCGDMECSDSPGRESSEMAEASPSDQDVRRRHHHHHCHHDQRSSCHHHHHHHHSGHHKRR